MLARTGRVGRLTTTGRRTGQRRTAYVGFARRPDESVIIGSGGTGRGWVANLVANPACSFSIRGEERAYAAVRLDGKEREAGLADLKATLGGRSEAFSYLDIFRLTPGS
jgi:deazaflavin-dependent oxidoreductase (nitroreductase family)